MLTLHLHGPMFAHKVMRALTWAALLVTVLTLANFLSQLIVPNIAHAGVLDVCDTNYQMPDPQNASNDAFDGKYTRVKGNDAYIIPDGSPYIGKGGSGAGFGTGGLTWSTYATSVCNPMDYGYNITTMVSGFFLSGLIAFASLMRFLLNIAFTTEITSRILDNATVQEFTRQVDSTLFREWGTLILLIAVVLVIGLVIRRRIKEGMTNLVWAAFASAMVLVVSTTSLMPTFGKSVNNITSSISTSMLMMFNGGDCKSVGDDTGEGNTKEQQISCMTTNMTSQFVTPVWAFGAAGQQANKQLNAITAVDDGGTADTIDWADDSKASIKVFWDKKGDTALDDMKDRNFGAIHLPPKGVVPTDNANGVPSTSDYLRWTQTYTGAEMKAMKDNPSMRCRSTSSPDKLEDLDEEAYKGGELCMKKWAVRAAIMYGLKNNDPSAYNAASGRDDLNSRIAPALLAYPVTGTVVMALCFVAMMMFAYQLEMALYLILTGLYFLGSIVKGPRLMLDWLGWIGATAVKRIALGLMLGVLMLLMGILQQIFTTGMVAGAGAMSVVLLPLVQQAFFIAGLVAMLLMWKKFRKWSLQTTRLEKYGSNKLVQSSKKAATKALSVGGAATAAAVTGGTSAAVMAGGAATLRKTPDEGGAESIMTNIHSAARQGRMVRDHKAAKESAKTEMLDYQDQHSQAVSQAEMHGQQAQEHGQAEAVAQSAVNELTGENVAAQQNASQAHDQAQDALHNFTVQHTTDGQTLHHRLEGAQTELAANQEQAQKAELDLDQFLGEKNLSVSHHMDSNGNLQIRDLKTGEVTTGADPSAYNPNLEISNLLPNLSDQASWASLQSGYTQSAQAAEQSELDVSVISDDLNRAVDKERAKAANMSLTEIENEFPKDTANDLKQWKTLQAKAQRLSAHAQDVQARLSERQGELARAQSQKSQSLNDMASEQMRAQSAERHRDEAARRAQKLNTRQLNDLLGGRGGRR